MRSGEFSEGESDSDSQLLSFADYHYKGQSIYEDSPQSVAGDSSAVESVLKRFPYNVYFKTENFLTEPHFYSQYDTITW